METGIPCMGWGNNQLVIGAPNGNTLGIDILNSICVNFDWINHILGWEQDQKQGYTKFTKLVTWILLWKKYIVHRCFKARYSSLSWTTAFLFNWLTNLVFKIWLKWNKKSFHSNAIKLKWLFFVFCILSAIERWMRHWHHHHQESDQHYCQVNRPRQHPASLWKDYNKRCGQSFTERFEGFVC